MAVTPDTSVFSKLRGFDDYQRANDEFMQRKALQQAQIQALQQKALTGGSDLPAPIQLANEFQKARAAGDTQRMVDIAGFAKIYDRGVMPDANGAVASVNGYADAIGQIEQGKQTGKNISDLGYKPAIAGAEQMAKANVDIQTKPIIEKATSIAGKVGNEIGDRSALLNSMQANMPQLEATVNKLSELGKTATYTVTGRALNTAKREAGLSVPQGAIDRKEYISLVDNQILPLLRQTFGAQFTQKEGDSLKATLGDTNASPEEKDAVLRSFIEQKKATISSLQREVGGKKNMTPEEQGAALNELYGGDAAAPVTLSTDAAELSQKDRAESIFNAKAALRKGKNPDAIRKKLQDAGINPAEAGL